MISVCGYPSRPEESFGCPVISLTEDCELPFGFWELNSGSLKEQQMLLTTKLSLQCTLIRCR